MMKSKALAQETESMPEASLSDVKCLGKEDEERWDNFVRQSNDGTFYHLSGWRKIIGNFLGHPTYYLYVEQGSRLEGVLPLARVKSWLFGDALISLPFLVYGGPIARSASALELLLKSAVELAESLGVDYLELRNRSPVTDWPVKDSYVTFRKHLDSEIEANMSAIPRKQRAMIRKGFQAGLEAHVELDTGRLYDVLSECKRNLGTPFFSRAYLRYVKETFGEDCEILTVTHNGRVVCGVMSFIYENEILPYYGGGGCLARDLKGNDFMYWKVMERACQNGLSIFDYGRSMVGSGAYRFKKHWGFKPEPLSYQYHLVNAEALPNLNSSNPRYRFLINIWKRLPLSVAELLGPFVARRIG